MALFVYPFCLLFPLVLFLLSSHFWKVRRNLFYFLAFLPIVFFASVRGAVGTDTENYRLLYEGFETISFPQIGPDFLFLLSIHFFKYLGLDFQWFLASQAVFCLWLFSLGASRIDRHLPIFGLSILPLLVLDSTFNGLRYGLAFAVTVIVVPLFLERNRALRGLSLVLPSLFHFSLLPIVLIVRLNFLTSLMFFVFFVGLGGLYVDIFFSKAEAYSFISRPSGISGAFPTILFFSFLFLIFVDRPSLTGATKLTVLSVLLFCVGFFISSFSYAGLRIIQVAVLLIVIDASFFYRGSNYRAFLAFTYIVGVLSFINFSRQVFFIGSEGGVFFSPYVFF